MFRLLAAGTSLAGLALVLAGCGDEEDRVCSCGPCSISSTGSGTGGANGEKNVCCLLTGEVTRSGSGVEEAYQSDKATYDKCCTDAIALEGKIGPPGDSKRHQAMSTCNRNLLDKAR
jgi:hypothetical protein